MIKLIVAFLLGAGVVMFVGVLALLAFITYDPDAEPYAGKVDQHYEGYSG